MPRKSIAPWSERVAEGLIDQPIDSSITASQTLRATVDTGFIDQTGTWRGIVSSDPLFSSIQTDIGIANGVSILTPSVNADGTWPLDMTGYQNIQIAILPTNGGNYAIEGVMGPDSVSYGNLSPVNAASALRGNTPEYPVQVVTLLLDTGDTLTANVWNIFMIKNTLANQKLLQFKITNNSGGSSDIQTAFMRLV